MRRIYLDHASTTPLAPEARRAMLPFLAERFGNASSPHLRGLRSRQVVEEARAAVASLVRARPEEIVFTGSATEANNLALKGIAHRAGDRRRRIVASATEHISILHPLRTLQKEGFHVTLLPVDRHGFVDLDDLRRSIDSDTLLVTVAHASGEIGTIQPLVEICRIAHERQVSVHTDATMTAGALRLPEGADRPDLVTLAPHLFYGPQGVGALSIRGAVRVAPLIEGGVQEGGLRAGTESLAAIAGFGAAALLAEHRMERRAACAAALSERLRRSLLERIENLVPTGHPTSRVPGHVSLCVRGIEAEALLRALDEAGIEAGSGSACTTEAGKPSHVLEAIGVDPVLSRGALVLSFGEENRDDDPDAAASVLAAAIPRLRQMSPL